MAYVVRCRAETLGATQALLRRVRSAGRLTIKRPAASALVSSAAVLFCLHREMAMNLTRSDHKQLLYYKQKAQNLCKTKKEEQL
jgi:hypothetical protein